MAKFTTEERRDLTSSDTKMVDERTKSFMNLQFDEAYAKTIHDDRTNNMIFVNINSVLTGLSFEYRYLTGRYHPDLDETKYYYKHKDEKTDEIITDFYWDNERLHEGARLEKGNEFHLNIREGTTVKYPIRPYKYSKWLDDSETFVIDFEVTEANMISMIRQLDTWYTSGGGSGNVETTVFGEYSEYELGFPDEKQKYMTIAYYEYQTDPNNEYMEEGYDSSGEIILINGTDLENFSFGVIIRAKDLPSRILLDPYCKTGEIPDNSSITSTFNAGSEILKKIAEQIVFKLKKYFLMIQHYLGNNPNNEDTNNEPILTSVNNVISLIETWEELQDRDSFSRMLQLLTDIEAERTTTLLNNRISYIDSFLPTQIDLYNKRFDIIDLRLSKNMGTLKEVMTSQKGLSMIDDILTDRENADSLYNDFFIVKTALLDGDYYMRIFVEEADGLSVGDTCFILTNNKDVPEIEAEITEIVDGRVKDMLNSKYDEKGNVEFAYNDCKKVFFGNEIFSKDYLIADRFRIVKEI